MNASDPVFLRTPSPGPDTLWGTLDDDYGDLHIALNSPAIDFAPVGCLHGRVGRVFVLACSDDGLNGFNHFDEYERRCWLCIQAASK